MKVPMALGLALIAFLPQAQGQARPDSIVRIGPLEFHDSDHHGRGHQVVIGGDAILKEGETNHSIVVVMGDATIDGTVSELVCVLSNVKVGPTGNVKRRMVLVGGELDLHPDATFNGFDGPKIVLPAWISEGIRDWLRGGLLLGRPIAHQLGWVWAISGAFMLLYLLVAALVPRPVQSCVNTIEAKPLTSFLTGMIALILTGPLLGLLVVTVVGAIIVPFVLCGILAGIVVGRAAVFRCIGQQLIVQSSFGILQTPLIALAAGAILVMMLYAVPFIGFLVWGLVGTLGFGAAVLAALKALRSEMPRLDHAYPMAGAVSTDTPQTVSAAESAALLPAAGFWIRLAATVLDALLIGMVILFVLNRHAHDGLAPKMFIPVWFTYHVVLWSWKSTTLGGIVLRLKVVRINGGPINFAVALVRSLAAFFSALVFCLGFFWVGWNRERQSWHDMIAGTVIVRMPPGTPMV